MCDLFDQLFLLYLRMITAAVVLMKNKSKDKHNNFPIYIKLTLDRKVSYINTSHKCKEDEWLVKTSSIKSSVPNAITHNGDIRRQYGRIDKIIMDHRYDELALSLIKLKELINDEGESVKKFRDFATTAIAKLRKTIQESTCRQYDYELSKMDEYKTNVALKDITKEWLEKYETHMKESRHNQVNTVWKTMKMVRKMMNMALVDKIIRPDQYPFGKGGYRLNFEESLRTYLTMEEVDRITDTLHELPRTVADVGWSFVLCCYCGLRYGDAANFDFDKMIVNNHIILVTEKTSTVVSIKIHTRLAKAIEQARLPHKIQCNQVTNRYLKIIADKATIDKVVTFHVARHTFGVECANLGIPIEVVQKLLGHEDIKTTAIYYKIINTTVDREMDKWN